MTPDLAFQTHSIRARPVGESDLPLYLELYTHPGVMRHVGPVMTAAEAGALFRKVLLWNAESPARARYWSIRSADDARDLGIFSVVRSRGAPTLGEMGVMLLPCAWGKGLARHVTEAMISRLRAPDWGLDLERLCLTHSVSNTVVFLSSNESGSDQCLK